MINLNKMIEVLEQGDNITLNGQLFEEDHDSISIQVGSSLIDIPKQHILSRRDVNAATGNGNDKIVDVTIDKNAKIIQRAIVSALSFAETASSNLVLGGIGLSASACACACECNCACDCACGSKEEMSQFIQTMAFRNPMIPKILRSR